MASRYSVKNEHEPENDTDYWWDVDSPKVQEKGSVLLDIWYSTLISILHLNISRWSTKSCICH